MGRQRSRLFYENPSFFLHFNVISTTLIHHVYDMWQTREISVAKDFGSYMCFHTQNRSTVRDLSGH